MSPLLEFAIRLASDAGKATLPHFQSRHFVLKEDRSPVSDGDLAAERLIRERLATTFPDHGILGEEGGCSGDADHRWVIDPIDGTKSFVAGVPLYATLLSYEEHGQPLIGVCYFPALDELLYAEKGAGAYFQGSRIRVPQEMEPARSILCCGSLTHLADQGCLDRVVAFSREMMGLRTWCDAYGHALVATGRAAAMIDPVVQPYDVSAMRLILAEAGAICTDFQGNAPGSDTLSAHPAFHAKLLAILRS